MESDEHGDGRGRKGRVEGRQGKIRRDDNIRYVNKPHRLGILTA